MCGAAISLTSRALNDVGNAEVLLKIKGFIALFVQTMEVCAFPSCWLLFPNLIQGWGYSISTLDTFLLTLFDKYAELLKHRFSEDFQEVSIMCPDLFDMPLMIASVYRLSLQMTTCQWPLILVRNMKKSLTLAGSCKAKLSMM